MQNYVSLIIDIKNSKTYDVYIRNEMQRYVMKCIDCLNKLFASRLQYAVTFSAGDELQGLFLDVTAAILYFRLFEILLHPVKVRAGIGIGAWTVKIENGLSTQQDGSAYHRARQAITEVHAMQLHNIRIDSDGDVLSNCLINASYTLKQQQNRMQNFALVVLELAYPFMSIRGKIPKNDTMVLEELLWNKFEWKSKSYYLIGHAPGRMESPYLGSGYMQSMDSVLIDGYPIEAEKVVRKKNMSLVVAEILGCTRQNADSLIRRGNTNKIRELDYMALQYIEKLYGG